MSEEEAALPDEPDPACWYHGCGKPDAPHAIVWKCPAGHRMTLRYCGEHAGTMMTLALQAAAAADPDDAPWCARCPDPGAAMRPVTESALQR